MIDRSNLPEAVKPTLYRRRKIIVLDGAYAVEPVEVGLPPIIFKN